MSLPSSTVSPRPSTPPTTSATILPQHQVALRPTTTATYSHRHLLCSTSGALRSRRERLRRRRREIVGLLVVGGVLSSLALCLLALIVVFKNRPIVVLPAEVSPSPELVRRVFERNESILLPVESVRVKRDFMFVSDANATDPQCFEQCDAAYRVHLKEALQLNDAADFYDFPFHPALLERAAHIRYCDVVAARNKCYSDKCNDLATDAVFSPGNFLCSFKRAAFVDVLPCLAEAEPIAFLKCDRPCQTQTRAAAEKQQQMRNSTAVLTTICM